MRLRGIAPLLLLTLACKPDNQPGGTSLTFPFDGGAENGGNESGGNDVTSNPTDDPSAPTGSGEATSNGPTSNGPTSGVTDTEPDPSAPSTPGESSSSAEDTSSSASVPSTDPVECDDPLDQPLDSECTDSSGCGCASGKCFVAPILGGRCSECTVDADCPDGGCTVPNVLTGIGARCNQGEAGAGCMTDAVCNDPGFQNCAVVLEVPNVITASTCSQCEDNGDCPAPLPNCAPQYDLAEFSGVKVCAANGTIPDGQGCEIAGGDAACNSGYCGEASVMGLFVLGVCGECEIDDHCGPGGSCIGPEVDLQTAEFIPAVCV